MGPNFRNFLGRSLKNVLRKFRKFGPWLLLTAYKKLPAPYPMVQSLTPYDLPPYSTFGTP